MKYLALKNGQTRTVEEGVIKFCVKKPDGAQCDVRVHADILKQASGFYLDMLSDVQDRNIDSLPLPNGFMEYEVDKSNDHLLHALDCFLCLAYGDVEMYDPPGYSGPDKSDDWLVFFYNLLHLAHAWDASPAQWKAIERYARLYHSGGYNAPSLMRRMENKFCKVTREDSKYMDLFVKFLCLLDKIGSDNAPALYRGVVGCFALIASNTDPYGPRNKLLAFEELEHLSGKTHVMVIQLLSYTINSPFSGFTKKRKTLDQTMYTDRYKMIVDPANEHLKLHRCSVDTGMIPMRRYGEGNSWFLRHDIDRDGCMSSMSCCDLLVYPTQSSFALKVYCTVVGDRARVELEFHGEKEDQVVRHVIEADNLGGQSHKFPSIDFEPDRISARLTMECRVVSNRN